MSEAFINNAFLALSGGFQDAYTYNTRNEVFSNAQTGNVVLMSQNLMTGNWQKGLRYAKKLHWRQSILLMEILILFVVGFMPAEMNMGATALVSFACAMQVQAFRKVDGYAYASTMCIGNLRSGMAALSAFMRNHKKQQLEQVGHYFGVIFLFAVGAGIGGNLSIHYGVPVIWGSCILLLISFCLMFAEQIE